MNFKKVLLGECSDLDVREQSQWPELGKVNNGRNVCRKKSRTKRSQINDEEIKNTETNNSDQNTGASQTSSSKNNLPSPDDFPNLTDTVDNHLEKRNRLDTMRSLFERNVQDNTNVNKESSRSSKCKKPKKSLSKAPISLDLNVMLKISLSIAERKRQRKRMLHSQRCLLPLQEKLSDRIVACGNKLDSDCPIRHKGKKRPHKRRKPTTIKRSFQRAAGKSPLRLSDTTHLTKRMNRLRQIILAGIGKGQAVDELVTALGRLGIDDVQNSTEVQPSLPVDSFKTAKTVVHSKNFRPYCDHVLRPSLKSKANEFITTLRIYQDNMYARDPINSKSRRRYVCGCHEARKYLRIDSVKLLFIANNLIVDNGMPAILEELLRMAKELDLPIIFAGTAMDLGLWTLKKRKTSVIAVLRYEGAEKLLHDLLEELELAKNEYDKLVQNIGEQLQKVSISESSHSDENELQQQEVEDQIRDNIISKLS